MRDGTAFPMRHFCWNPSCKSGNCPICGRPVEWITEEAYFFRLSKYQDWILDHIETHPTFIQPVSRRNEVLSFVRSGLRDLCVSRSTFTWGIPVPFDPSQVIYVWIDALTNYITAIGYGADSHTFRKILAGEHPPHRQRDSPLPCGHLADSAALRRPATPNAGLCPWLVDRRWREDVEIEGQCHRSWPIGGGVSSESWCRRWKQRWMRIRYFVLREVAFGLDGDFSHAALVQRFNSDLANDLGNLLSRTLSMLERYCQGTVPEPTTLQSAANVLAEAAAKLLPDLDPLLNELAFHRALARLWEYVRLVNRYIDEQAPWALARDPAQRRQLDTVLYNQVESLRIVALLLFPFMPHTAASMWHQLGIQGDIATQRLARATVWGGTRPGTSIQPGEQLFPRIDAGRPIVGSRAHRQGR